MPDEQNPLHRARPAAPAIPPFRGHAPAARSALVPKAPGSGRGAPPVVAVRPAKPQQADAEQAVAAVGPVIGVEAPTVVQPETALPALVLEPPGAEVMPFPVTSELRASAAPTLAPEAWGTYAPPAAASLGAAEQPPDPAASEPLAGLPFFDDAGHPHGAVQSPVAQTADCPESQLHAAAVLERVAAGIRAGVLTVDGVDASAGEPAALAAVLASLLRQQR